MKWFTISSEERRKRKLQWHEIFALIPHKIEHDIDGKNKWVWLERIARKYKIDQDWKYGTEILVPIYCSLESAVEYKLRDDNDINNSGDPTPPPPRWR